jgi:hypothetical protein
MATVTNLTSLTDASQLTSLTQLAGLLKINRSLNLPQNQVTGSIVSASSKTRPLWFDGRFLAAQDLERDQNYFLAGQAVLGQAAGFGVIHGLTVSTVSTSGQPPDAETIVISAGQGLTPGGQLVMLSTDLTVLLSDLTEEENLDVQFGLSQTPSAIARTRTGLYVIALRPVQFTANPITSYPANIQGTRNTHDGSIIEATAVSLVPYPVPSANFDSTSQNAAAARQVFVENNAGTLSDSLLPVAMISVERGAIQWLDQWMVRRDSVPATAGLRFGLANTATQQAYLMQYDAQLQQIVNPMAQQAQAFPATNYFQALPPAGRFPMAGIDTTKFTQIFFPPQTNVTLSLVPDDELPALIEDSMYLAPIDLTLAASAYADLAVYVLIPVSRATFNTLSLQPVALTSALPQVLNVRQPLDLLRFFQNSLATSLTSVAAANWQSAIAGQTYGYYVRRRSVPAFISFSLGATTTSLAVSAVTGSAATQYTATVTPSAATGTVAFLDGTTTLGTVNIQSGIATLVLPALAAGTHSLTAVYQGDTNYASSTSAAVTQTVAGT